MNNQSNIHNLFSLIRVFVFSLIVLTILFNIDSYSSVIDAAAQDPCGDTYIVLPGDTIEDIANLCGTSVEAILKINPEITDPNDLYTGQIIRIPEAEFALETLVAISPSCGFPGQSLLVVGSGFPINTNVQLSIGQLDQTFTDVGDTISDQFGRIDTTIVIPSSAAPNTDWVVIGEAQVSSAKFTANSNSYYVISQTPDPNSGMTYVVQEGDSLRSIAEKHNRNLAWLLEANPRLSFSVQLSPGDIIQIPPQEPGSPRTTVNPICGPIESEVDVNGEKFPPSIPVNLSMGQYLDLYEPVSTVLANSEGTFQTQLTIPVSAQLNELWVVLASSGSFRNVRSTSNIFTITPPHDPQSPQLYIVKPGDTLNQIAVEFGRTVASILSANPQITNPNQLEIGEKIIIPGQQETIIISPVSGTPLSLIQAIGFGFKPSSSITLGMERNSILYSIQGDVATDINGFFQEDIIIPSASQPGDIWSVVAIEPDSTGGEVFAKSNDFTVTSPQAPLQPNLTIWPLAGPSGTLLSIVANNFPSKTEIRYNFGALNSSPYYTTTTWTDINGSFAADLIIPMSAEGGEIWVVNAEVIEDLSIQTTTPDFTVISP